MTRFEKAMMKYSPCYNCEWGKKVGKNKIACSRPSCVEPEIVAYAIKHRMKHNNKNYPLTD